MRKTYDGLITKLEENQIFVFGSNPEGRHGKGTAKIASVYYGAVRGQGHGLQGQSYGLVTKNMRKGYYDKELGLTFKKYGARSVSKKLIMTLIGRLYKCATELGDKEFLVAYTADGKNLNGYTSVEMAGLFRDAGVIPANIVFEDKFWGLMGGDEAGSM